MNKDEAQVALDNKIPVVDMYTGEMGLVQAVNGPDGGARVLYLGSRLARITQLADLDTVRPGREVSALSHYLQPAGKVHGGPKGAEGK